MSEVRIEGLGETLAAFDALDREIDLGMKAELRQIGDVVSEAAKRNLAHMNTPAPDRTVQGIKTRVRQGGRVVSEQSLRKTTGARPDWGEIQMVQGFLPAADEAEPELRKRTEILINRLCEEV